MSQEQVPEEEITCSYLREEERCATFVTHSAASPQGGKALPHFSRLQLLHISLIEDSVCCSFALLESRITRWSLLQIFHELPPAIGLTT
jgi:hypothetical protein